MISRILIGILIISLSSCVGVTVTEARNEYLNNGTNTCSTGSFDISVEQRESEYYHRPYDPTNSYSNPSDDQSLRLTWRKYLGSACTKEFKEVQQENMELKQQLELMKMCGKVNRNPTLKRNPNFALLVSKCSGIIINDEKQARPDGSYWDKLTDSYKKEHKDKNLWTQKTFTGLGKNE